MPGRAGSMQASCLPPSLCLTVVVAVVVLLFVVIGAIDKPICPSIARVGWVGRSHRTHATLLSNF